MKLTSRGKYAIQAMLDLVEHANGKAVKLSDISIRQGISLFYLEQLFRKLRQGGVVKSVRGPGGGYVLTGEPSSITIASILTSVKEVMDYASKINLEPEATDQAKAMASFAGSLSDSVKANLMRSLADLAKKA